VDAVAKLKELNETRDRANEQIQAIEQVIGADPVESKPKKTNKFSNCGSKREDLPDQVACQPIVGGERG
jgi:hypothetical protein